MLSNVSFHPETRFPDNKIVTKSKEAGSIITLYLNFEDDERKTFPARESTFRLVQHPRTTELDDIIKLWCCFQPLSCIKKQPPPKKKKKERKKEIRRKERKKAKKKEKRPEKAPKAFIPYKNFVHGKRYSRNTISHWTKNGMYGDDADSNTRTNGSYAESSSVRSVVSRP